MKRKRGSKKSKRKGGGKEVPSSVTEENSGLEEFDNDNNKYDSAMEVDTPSSTGTDHLLDVANVNNNNLEGSMEKKPAGNSSVGRVKVKLKTSIMMDAAQLNSSDALTQSDTDKSSLQMGLEKQSVISEKMEDSANSLPEKETGVSGTASKKPGSIKIKSSKSFGGGNTQTSTAVKAQGGNRMPQQDSRPNKKELDCALMVIKKVMKMEAAEPFNVPVNPVALGIPDYFDVIDTPMDFGTICSNLDNGIKYMNSEGVFKDVQYIWGNCYKYNNKGDYILDLMRRVKKNFSKYWSAAGLYNGQVTATNGVDITQENGASSQVKLKGQSKQKTKKRHGRRHKSDCLCAICVLKRRRKEREEIARIEKDQIGGGNNPAQEFKIEESLRVESPGSVDSSSNADDSLDNELDVEEETGEEVKMDVSKQQFSTPEEKQQDEDEEEKDEEGNEMERKMGTDSKGTEQSERPREDHSRPLKSTMEQTTDLEMEDVLPHEGGQQEIDESEHKEVEEKRKKKVKAWEELSIKNPMVLELCGVVFPVNPRSVWRGPHSLLPHHQTSRTTSIHMAIDKLMKK